MDDPTDLALGICTAVGLALCAACMGINAWKTSRGWRSSLKTSRSDTDLSSMLDNAIPSASALTIRRPPVDDPSEASSEA